MLHHTLDLGQLTKAPQDGDRRNVQLTPVAAQYPTCFVALSFATPHRLYPGALRELLVDDVVAEVKCGSYGEPNRPVAVVDDVVEEMVVDYIGLQADGEVVG